MQDFFVLVYLDEFEHRQNDSKGQLMYKTM